MIITLARFFARSKIVFPFIFLFFLLFTLSLLHAEELSPINLLKSKLEKIQKIASDLPENFNKEQEEKAKKDTREELEGLIDREHISLITLGETRWQKLKVVQKEKFQKLFQKLLLNKLSLAGKKNKMGKSKKENLKKFKAIKLNIIKQADYNDTLFKKPNAILVRTMVPAQEIDIPIDFMFYKNKSEPISWKIYDIHIDGKSTIWYYRKQFSRIIQKKGFHYLIQRLEIIVNK